MLSSRTGIICQRVELEKVKTIQNSAWSALGTECLWHMQTFVTRVHLAYATLTVSPQKQWHILWSHFSMRICLPRPLSGLSNFCLGRETVLSLVCYILW